MPLFSSEVVLLSCRKLTFTTESGGGALRCFIYLSVPSVVNAFVLLRADHVRGGVVDDRGLEHFLPGPLDYVLIARGQWPCHFLPNGRSSRRSEVEFGEIQDELLGRAAVAFKAQHAQHVAREQRAYIVHRICFHLQTSVGALLQHLCECGE